MLDELLGGEISEEERMSLSEEQRQAIPRLGPGSFRWKMK
jgi:hypothetical protein